MHDPLSILEADGMDIRESKAPKQATLIADPDEPNKLDKIDYIWIDIFDHLNEGINTIYLDGTIIGDTIGTDIMMYGESIMGHANSMVVLVDECNLAVKLIKNVADPKPLFGKVEY